MGQIILLASFLFFGLITLIVMLLLLMFWWIPVLQDVRKVLEVVLLLFPPYALGGGFLSLATAQIRADLYLEFGDEQDSNLTTVSPFDWTVIGRNLTVLATETVLFFLANLIWETAMDRRRPQQEGSKGDRPVLGIEGVTKLYRNLLSKFKAVDDLSLRVGRGECFGLIGLNGAGKSTTFQMVTGSLAPTSGTISLGCSRIGYCPQADAIDPHLTVTEQLRVAALLAGYSLGQSAVVAAASMTSLSLEQYSAVLCGDLSGGNKRKVCTGVALTGRPQLVLMDEPTTGLDPGSKRHVWNCIRMAVAGGQSVLLTSHSMAEVDTLCDRLAILAEGRVKATGSPDQLKHQLGGGYKVNLKLVPGSSSEEICSLLGAVPGLISLGQRHQWLTYRVPGQLSVVLGLLASARQQGSLQGFTINMTSLDDIFLEVTSGGKDQGSLRNIAREGLNDTKQPYDPLGAQEIVGGSPREEAVYRRPGSVEGGGETEGADN